MVCTLTCFCIIPYSNFKVELYEARNHLNPEDERRIVVNDNIVRKFWKYENDTYIVYYKSEWKHIEEYEVHTDNLFPRSKCVC